MLAKSLCAPPLALIDRKGLETSLLTEAASQIALTGTQYKIAVEMQKLFAAGERERSTACVIG